MKEDWGRERNREALHPRRTSEIVFSELKDTYLRTYILIDLRNMQIYISYDVMKEMEAK